MRSSMSGSVSPHTSTSSTNTTMQPCRLRSFITWFVKFISVSCDNSPTRNAVGGVHDPPPRLSGIDFIASLHTIYAYLTGLLLALTGLKYQGSSSSNPFSEHPTLMMLFLVSIFVYFTALITMTRSNWISDHCHHKLMIGVCHISGAVACELLLLVLVSPLRSLLINVSSSALIAMLVLCYKYLLQYLCYAEETEEGGSEIVGLEVPPTISTA